MLDNGPGDLAWREVDLAAIRHNVRRLAEAAGDARLMVVVKADAYSHGAVAVARTAVAAGAGMLGVATLAEAFELRAAGIEAPVLAWLHAPGADYDRAIREGIELAAHSGEQLGEIAAAATGIPARVHLKVETGMWRGGAGPEQWPGVLDDAGRLEREGAVEVVGIMSHLACADTPDDPSVGEQLRAFDDAVAAAYDAGLRPTLRHIANSAATIARPDAHYDMVRCGLAVYGVNPFVDREPGIELRPAMSVRARVGHVKRAPAGAGVSYGHTYRTARPTTLATVPLGYADGMPLDCSETPVVGVGGDSAPVAGRVCMDQFVIDAGDLTIAPGDTVTVLGDGSAGELTAVEWSAVASRSRYEMLTQFGRPRVGLRHVG